MFWELTLIELVAMIETIQGEAVVPTDPVMTTSPFTYRLPFIVEVEPIFQVAAEHVPL